MLQLKVVAKENSFHKAKQKLYRNMLETRLGIKLNTFLQDKTNRIQLFHHFFVKKHTQK
jgi:hypothetical protein